MKYNITNIDDIHVGDVFQFSKDSVQWWFTLEPNTVFSLPMKSFCPLPTVSSIKILDKNENTIYGDFYFRKRPLVKPNLNYADGTIPFQEFLVLINEENK